VRASDGQLQADRDVDLDRLRGTIAAATSEPAAPGASDGPPPYTPPATIVVNGITYKVVGSITTTLVVNQSAAWLTHLPMGIALAAQPFLLKVAWPNIIKPVLGAVSQGVLRIAGFGAAVEGAELTTTTTVAEGAARVVPLSRASPSPPLRALRVLPPSPRALPPVAWPWPEWRSSWALRWSSSTSSCTARTTRSRCTT